MLYIFRPIENWQGPAQRVRKRSTFRTPWNVTLQDLQGELEKLAAKNIVIQIDLDGSDLRQDGMPRAHARPRTPRVCLSFESKHGPLSYPCDAFDDWQDNVRAIALALAALRAVDRYGVTKRAEQYKGWEKLGGPAPVTVDRNQLISELSHLCGDVHPGQLAAQVKAARIKWHPDRHGGDATKARRVGEIAGLLGID